MVVILTMVNLTAHSKINCQVRAVFCIIFLRTLTGYNSKAWVTIAYVSIPTPAGP